MTNIDQTERELVAIKLGKQASDNYFELVNWLGEVEAARERQKRFYNKKEDRTLASKYIIEYHTGDNITQETIRKSIEEIEKIMISKSNNFDQILIYTPSETIVCGFRKGKKISYVVDYVREE